MSKLEPKDVTVVTPWLNHRELSRGYWRAVRAAGCHVLIVDDGSTPPLPNGVRTGRQGFARASNLGLSFARTDAVLFLNNDVEATRPDWLAPVLGALEPGVLVGAKLRTDRHGWVDGQPLPYLDGWCLAGMRYDLDDLGGWDEDYTEPSYYGDNDLSLRARAAGMSLREAPVGLRHLGGNTTTGHGPDVQAAAEANQRRFAARARELLTD